jgi:hypothetical protein
VLAVNRTVLLVSRAASFVVRGKFALLLEWHVGLIVR